MDDTGEMLRRMPHIELRAVIRVDGKETDVHFSNKQEPTWRIGLCNQKTKQKVIPVARRVFEALYKEGYYRNG